MSYRVVNQSRVLEVVVPNGECFEVEVKHFRVLKNRILPNKIVEAGAVLKEMRENFSCRGGKTVVSLLQNGHEISSGVAQCLTTDNFNRKYGFRLALDRAVKNAFKKV